MSANQPDNRSPNGTSRLYEGVLAPDSSCADVVNELVSAIESSTGLLPQKYLYASLTGARLWHDLCAGKSHIADVYKRFPLGGSRDPLTNEFNTQARSILTKTHPIPERMGLIALGVGTGTREAKISDQLLKELPLKGLDAYLVDVSRELLGESLKSFRALDDRVKSKFAILDFESPNGQAELLELRAKFGSQPTVFLLLGNTFGNIDQDTFVAKIANLMRPNDLLLCEVLLATETETQALGTQHGEMRTECETFDARNDPRAQFMLDPLRSLGFNPKFENLKRWVASTPGKWKRDEYRYCFDPEERQLARKLSLFHQSINPLTLASTSWIGLLNIQAVTSTYCKDLFKTAFSNVKLVQHSYTLTSTSVCMGYCFASQPMSSASTKETGSAPQRRQDSAAKAKRLIINQARREVTAESETLTLTISHFSLLLLWCTKYHAAAPEPNGMTVQLELKSKLNELLLDPQKKFEQKTNGMLQRLEKNEAVICNVKSDFKRRLRMEKKAKKAASFLLKNLPPNKMWNLLLNPSDISIE